MAAFTARGLTSAEPERLIVRLARPGRMLNADVLAGLDHPSIQQIGDAGKETIDGVELDFAALEAPSITLASALVPGPLQPDEARPIAAALLAALKYLHEHGLVSMHLAPENVILAGERWKLGRPELARSAGRAVPAETRALLGRSPNAPPEAFTGMVSPAWDMWSFGMLLRQLLMPRTPRGGKRGGPAPQMPAPFDRVVAQCLNSAPERRPDADAIAGMLGFDLMPNEPLPADRSSKSARFPTEPRPPESGLPTPVVEPPPVALPARRRRARTYDTSMPLATARNEPPAPRGPDYVIVDESAREPAAAAMPRRMAAPEPAEPPSRGKAHSFLNLGAWAVAGLLFGFLVFGYLATRTPDEKPPQPVANAPAVLPGDHSPTETAKEAPRPSPVPEDNPPNEADRTSDRRIDDVLRKWTDSTRHLDADGNADLYAPRVERFFNRRNVTRDDIRVEKERLFENIDQVRKFQVSNVVVDRVSPDQALISFRKEWDFAGKSPFSGAEKARMLLKRNGSQWQIAREEEIAVEWTKGKKRR